MDWRKLEPWQQPFQRASWVLAVVFGFVAGSPWWVRAWQDWQAAATALTQFETLLEETQTLRRETIQMQENPGRDVLPFIGASEISHLAQLNGLKPSTVVMDRAIPSVATEAAFVQQWPIHLHAAGSWASWLGWLAQWPTAMPGVTMASLDLRADAQGGVTIQVGLLSPRVLTPAPPIVQRDKLLPATHTNRDPFDIKAWQQALALQAQQHPSYALHAAPELRRTRQMLETFPRHQMRYVGHLSSGAELQALIQVAVADGKTHGTSPPVHRVRAGDRLGQDFGQVLLVEKHQLQLRELTANPKGEWQMRQVVMPLEVSP
jgi:type IV pilus assembly protein PilP